MATDEPTDIDRLQASVASLATAFTVPYGQLLRSLDNSNKMVEHLNGLLERFVLQAVSIRVRFFPVNSEDDDAVQALVDCSNLSDLTIEHITLNVSTAMHVTGEAGGTFTLGPLASSSVRLTLRGLRHDHRGSVDVTLPSPGTQATLRKAVPWCVPLSLRCRRQLRIGATAVADARHSAVVSASVVRSLFGLDASAVLPTGAGAEYVFTLPDGATHISAFVEKAFDHKNLVVVSPQENSSELLQDLQQSALS